MKPIVAFVCMFVLVSTVAQADVYVKGILHVDGGYRYGHNVPEMNVVNEWWFSENKVTFMSTGWRFGYFINTDWRFTFDKKKQRIIVANLKEKFFVEVPLQMNPFSHIDQSLTESLSAYQINGKIEKTEKRATIVQKKCEIYTISEQMIHQGEHLHNRLRTVMATTDVPFDWRLVNELEQWIRSFFNPQDSYISELTKVKGFVLATDDVLLARGNQIKSSFKVLNISHKKALQNTYEIPRDFKRKEKLSWRELRDMKGIIYAVPIF